MLKNPIALGVLAIIVAGGGFWLYRMSTDPLQSSCRKIVADWDHLGPATADALYDDLSPALKARTTRAGTRMYLDTVCRTETEDQDMTIGEIRARMERNLSAPPPGQ